MPLFEKKHFQRCLLRWFDRHKRDLPWRADKDPYRVWLSEIMLQQTRVTAVVEHYRRFLKRFPAINKLARAREASVLAAWSGLGYYRRARMLHAASKKIVNDYGGKFPASSAELQTLTGIGRYTAAAIASIAFGEPVAVVDGNVDRVLQRFYGQRISGEALWQAAQSLVNERRPGDHNQALMELGATVCLPREPKCPACPISALCTTRGELSNKKQRSLRQRKRQIAFLLDRRNGSTFLVRRLSGETLMPGMWELPEASEPHGTQPLFTLRHSITVTDYRVDVLGGTAIDHASGRWIPNSRLKKLPLTGLARKILRTAKVI